jgi:hypothetical protein
MIYEVDVGSGLQSALLIVRNTVRAWFAHYNELKRGPINRADKVELTLSRFDPSHTKYRIFKLPVLFLDMHQFNIEDTLISVRER